MNNALINPRSIVVVGASENREKPGGRLIANLIASEFSRDIYPVNPKEKVIQNLKAYNSVQDLPCCDLAFIAISAQFCPDTVLELAKNNETKAFIIVSAGFSEFNNEGKIFQKRIKKIASDYKLTIIGPNCIGVFNQLYNGVFVSPPPRLSPQGADFVSASGAFAVFLFEQSVLYGLGFNSFYSVGNSAVTGVEEVLEFWDSAYIPGASPLLKMVYVEQLKDAAKFYKHVQSLTHKGCRVLVLKPGRTEVGARAALSHTGALASDDGAFNLLMKKAGGIVCENRTEFLSCSCMCLQRELHGKRLAIITHAGGPAVILTDILIQKGFEIPELDSVTKHALLALLYEGASVSNPIDMMATANWEQLCQSIHLCNALSYIDGICVIYGSTGMEDLDFTYRQLANTIKEIDKPVYCIFPSTNSALQEMKVFHDTGRVSYPDETVMALALVKVVQQKKYKETDLYVPLSGKKHSITEPISEQETHKRLLWAGIPLVESSYISNIDELKNDNEYPMVAKVMGILHKTDVNGVITNINSKQQLLEAVTNLLNIKGAKGVLLQPMLQGMELFLGMKYHDGIGYSIHAGIGGVFVELLDDFGTALAPVSHDESIDMLRSLKAYKLFEGFRNKYKVDLESFSGIIQKFSLLPEKYPDIAEIDINPLMANESSIVAVDVRMIVFKGQL